MSGHGIPERDAPLQAAAEEVEDRELSDDDDDDDNDAVEHLWQVRDIQLGLVSGALLLAGFLTGLAGWEVAALVLSALALVVGGATFVPGALRKAWPGQARVGLLMTVGAVGATLLGEVEEAAMLAFLFSLSEGLEDYSLARTRHGLRALLDLVPRQATVLRDGAESVVDPDELVVGDLMVVKPCERLATDGVIRTGRTALDTSAITGESMPVEVGPADDVSAGAINGAGILGGRGDLDRGQQLAGADRSHRGDRGCPAWGDAAARRPDRETVGAGDPGRRRTDRGRGFSCWATRSCGCIGRW